VIKLLPIAFLDLMMLGVTFSGAVFTLIKFVKNKLQLTRRDWVLLGMYWSYTLFIMLTFLLEYIVYIQCDIEFNQSIYSWILITRGVGCIFTWLAITWSSGYKFGGEN